MSEQKEKTIQGLYFNSLNTVPENVSGASIAAYGPNKIVLSFFDEVPTPPETFQIVLDEKSNVVEQKLNVSDEYMLIRYVKFNAEMDLDTAKSIVALLSSQISELESEIS